MRIARPTVEGTVALRSRIGPQRRSISRNPSSALGKSKQTAPPEAPQIHMYSTSEQGREHSLRGLLSNFVPIRSKPSPPRLDSSNRSGRHTESISGLFFRPSSRPEFRIGTSTRMRRFMTPRARLHVYPVNRFAIYDVDKSPSDGEIGSTSFSPFPSTGRWLG